jgi:hypothetical protein
MRGGYDSMKNVIERLVNHLRHRMERCSENFATHDGCLVCAADARIIDEALHPDGAHVAVHYVPMKVHVDLCMHCEDASCCVSIMS